MAATFGIPLVRAEVPKRKREDDEGEGEGEGEEEGDGEGPLSESRFPPDMGMGMAGGSGDVLMQATGKVPKSSEGKKKMREAMKKTGRMGSRFQNAKLVKSINVSSLSRKTPK